MPLANSLPPPPPQHPPPPFGTASGASLAHAHRLGQEQFSRRKGSREARGAKSHGSPHTLEDLELLVLEGRRIVFPPGPASYAGLRHSKWFMGRTRPTIPPQNTYAAISNNGCRGLAMILKDLSTVLARLLGSWRLRDVQAAVWFFLVGRASKVQAETGSGALVALPLASLEAPNPDGLNETATSGSLSGCLPSLGCHLGPSTRSAPRKP